MRSKPAAPRFDRIRGVDHSRRMEPAMTICNMSIEAGARIGRSGRRTTFRYLLAASTPQRALTPRAGPLVHVADRRRRCLRRELQFDAGPLAPMVSWAEPRDCSRSTVSSPDRGQVTMLTVEGVERPDYMQLAPGYRQEVRSTVSSSACATAASDPCRCPVLNGRQTAVPEWCRPGRAR
jgi:hypothetical protein